MSTTPYVFKVGDVVYSCNSRPTFYRVTQRSRCMVTLRQLKSEETSGDGQSGSAIPLNVDAQPGDYLLCRGPVRRLKIKTGRRGDEYACLFKGFGGVVSPYLGSPIEYACR